MSFIKNSSKKIKKIYIEERKNIKNINLKRSEKLQADRVITLGSSDVYSPFFFLKMLYLFIFVISFHFFYGLL